MQINKTGFGNAVPPSKEHVVIYFLQKELSETEAIRFYNHFQKKKWKNQRHKKIANWKVAAWDWILKLCFQ